MQKYVLGFVVDEDGQSILLLRKNRPKFLAGRLNGVGGKVEDNENDVDAMVRECLEECDLFIPPDEWFLMGAMGDDKTYHVSVFAANAPLRHTRQCTDEELVKMSWSDIAQCDDNQFAPDVKAIVSHLAPPPSAT